MNEEKNQSITEAFELPLEEQLANLKQQLEWATDSEKHFKRDTKKYAFDLASKLNPMSVNDFIEDANKIYEELIK